MPSFGDSIFLFVLALLLFGPKKLPVLARELGKWVGEFRRASNEFKMQMEDELRQSEQEERLKKIEAMEAAAPKPAELPESTSAALVAEESSHPPTSDGVAHDWSAQNTAAEATQVGISSEEPVTATPLPIAEAGELKIMPPATGLPTPRSKSASDNAGRHGSALGGLLDAIPAAETNGTHSNTEPAETAHGH